LPPEVQTEEWDILRIEEGAKPDGFRLPRRKADGQGPGARLLAPLRLANGTGCGSVELEDEGVELRPFVSWAEVDLGDVAERVDRLLRQKLRRNRLQLSRTARSRAWPEDQAFSLAAGEAEQRRTACKRIGQVRQTQTHLVMDGIAGILRARQRLRLLDLDEADSVRNPVAGCGIDKVRQWFLRAGGKIGYEIVVEGAAAALADVEKFRGITGLPERAIECAVGLGRALRCLGRSDVAL